MIVKKKYTQGDISLKGVHKRLHTSLHVCVQGSEYICAMTGYMKCHGWLSLSFVRFISPAN